MVDHVLALCASVAAAVGFASAEGRHRLYRWRLKRARRSDRDGAAGEPEVRGYAEDEDHLRNR